jgi:hypothetical protein
MCPRLTDLPESQVEAIISTCLVMSALPALGLVLANSVLTICVRVNESMDVETSPQRGISISCLQPPLIRSIYLPFTKARCEALPRHTSSATPHRPGSEYLICGKEQGYGTWGFTEKQSEEQELEFDDICLAESVCFSMVQQGTY